LKPGFSCIFPGGAVLVSPSKVKPQAPEQRKRMSCQDGLETLKNDFTKVNTYILEKDIFRTVILAHAVNE
jgi:hypothetical protein